MNIDFGELSHRINIYTISISRDAIGGEIATKSLWKSCWAKVEPQIEAQKYTRHVSQEKQKLFIYMRYQNALHKKMLVEYGDEYYEIQSIINVEAAGQWLKIIAVKSEVAT